MHLDCDAFYAAVEELDRPELKDVPFAVGKGVLTTCNYLARKFGCRSGMAGFVAMKLCPELICLPLNFDKYIAKAKEVRQVIERYDTRFESASIDEAYLNITAYCEEHSMTPEDAVNQLRTEIHTEARITVSAGIAPNAKLAKIASNQNKPNGQYRIPSDRNAILEFMHELPCRKVNGVGRVLERELAEIGIKTCGDIFLQRAYLTKLFGEKAAHFLLQTHLGLGRTKVQPAGEYGRKSVGTEGTFGRGMSDPQELRDRLVHTAEELQGDLERTGFKGKTLCLKIKLHTYEVQTRQVVLPYAIYKKEDLYKYSLPMLEKLESEIPGMRLRLMGLRMTHLVNMKKPKDFFGKHAALAKSDSDDTSAKAGAHLDEAGWEVWPEEEFEAAAQQERQAEIEEMERLSQEHELLQSSQQKHGRMLNVEATSTKAEESVSTLPCPICSVPQPANDREFNDHIDFCLSRQTIREAVKETAPPASEPIHSHPLKKSTSSGNTQKRGRPSKPDKETGERNTKKRAFFT